VFQDWMFIFFLGYFSVYVIFVETHTPPAWLRITVCALSVRALLFPITEVILMMRMYGCGCCVGRQRRLAAIYEGFNNFATFWNLFVLFTETSNAIVILWLMFDIDEMKSQNWDVADNPKCDYNHVKSSECEIIFHPVAFALAIGIKWIHLTFQLMCFPGFGQIVLPAFYAVIGKDTIYFLLFLGVVLAGSFQSYWSLPIPDNLPAPGVSHLEKVFLKVFRMDILGDVQMFDLEGVKEQVEITRNGSGFTGSVDDGPESDVYHDAIIILIVFLSTIVAILIMNVTIGIVGENYHYNKSNANHLWCHYRSTYNMKLLLRWEMWRRCLWGHCCKDDENSMVPDHNGIYIGFHESWFLDANDTLEDMQEMLQEQKQVGEQLGRVTSSLQEKLHKLSELAREKQLDNERAETAQTSAYTNAQTTQLHDDENKEEDNDAKTPSSCAGFLPKF